MGAGHLPRMNAVLRSYMHARLAGVLKGAGTMDFYRKQREDHDGARPLWGDTARMDGEAPVATGREGGRTAGLAAGKTAGVGIGGGQIAHRPIQPRLNSSCPACRFAASLSSVATEHPCRENLRHGPR